MSYFREMLPKMIRYRLARLRLADVGMPLNLTFSVTNSCQSRCKTCQIWQLYREQPRKREDELRLDEIEAIFRSMGHIYVFNISGGEPFLRPDLPEIVALACRYLTPGVIHIPTNAIASRRVINQTRRILEVLGALTVPPHLTVKPSLDHMGARHDEIRGIPGNFEAVMTVYRQLRTLKEIYPRFHVELGTVISNWNVDEIDAVAAFVADLGVDSYRNEIAEQRSEMFNRTDPITPDADRYERAIEVFVRYIRADMQRKELFQRITNAFRLVYYRLAVRILRERRQVIPCHAGVSNAHMSPYGDVWACCTLGYDRSMGNLRAWGYDFRALWSSPQARQVRSYVRKGRCACPLANQMYSNMLLHGPSLAKVLKEMLRS